MSSIISIRVNEAEADILKKAAHFYGCSISSLLKRLAIEKIEDDFDLAMIKEYEEAKKRGNIEYRPIEELFEELEI